MMRLNRLREMADDLDDFAYGAENQVWAAIIPHLPDIMFVLDAAVRWRDTGGAGNSVERLLESIKGLEEI